MEQTNSNLSIENIVGEILVSKNLTISTAESCTGGLLSATLVNYPGISSVLFESIVTYSNESKIKRLGVKRETLEKYGAVSEETALEMVEGLVRLTGAQIGISVTGIAGPGGGSLEKPVGLVYIGIYIKGKIQVKKFNFLGSRIDVRHKTVEGALLWLEEELRSI